VKEGNFSRLFEWAEDRGVMEYDKIKMKKPIIDLIYIFYSRQDLREIFPEVESNHDISNLLLWGIEKGVFEEPLLSKHKDFFLEYNAKVMN